MDNANFTEARRHSSPAVPFSYYESQIPDYFPNVPIHCHKEFEINHILSGEGEFTVGDQKFAARAGDVVVIQPNVLHAVSRTGGGALRYDTLTFSETLLLSGSADRCSLEYILPLSEHSLLLAPLLTKNDVGEKTVGYITQIFVAAKQNTALSDLMLKSALCGFFAVLLTQSSPALTIPRRADRSELIRPAVEYMSSRFSEKITIDELAAACHLSASYFMKVFRQYSGMSAVQYLNEIRIREVCKLLRTSSESVSGAAFACGFSNLSNFNRRFRKQVGVSPREYAEGK